MGTLREEIKDKKRIVIKIGSSSLQHKETGGLDYTKLDVLVRELCNIANQGKEVVLVSSGAIAVGKRAVHIGKEDNPIAVKQACAAIGQARLMMTYQKLFAEYNQTIAQILVTKNVVTNGISRINAVNTIQELLTMGVIPIVNENDVVSTDQILDGNFGDNDTLSALVAKMIGADLLILLSDIDGLYTDDPRSNPDAKFISLVPEISQKYLNMGKETSGSSVGTGGMSAKLAAARIATDSGADMVIANGDQVDVIMDIMSGKEKGTLFLAHPNLDFDLMHYLNNEY